MATFRKFIPAVEFHPGITLAEKLQEMGMSIKEFALRTSKPEKTIHAVIGGSSSVTSDMAVAFENVTKIPAHFWLNLQKGYDEYVARRKREMQLESDYAWACLFPVSEMTDLGWLPTADSKEKTAHAMFSFFQVSTAKAWQDYYLNQQLKVAFRISLNGINDPYATSAWLRRGEIQASEMTVEEFSDKALREAIPAMKALCAEQPENFAEALQEMCAAAGVKLVYTEGLQNAPINGATRWLKDVPCIQMSGRLNRNDKFWFTFFHELGHILLHGKKDIFLEDIDYPDRQTKKEEEADAFASRTLLPQAAEKEIAKAGDYSADAIRRYAEKYKTHPGIIAGRLQHKGLIPKEGYADLFEAVALFR